MNYKKPESAVVENSTVGDGSSNGIGTICAMASGPARAVSSGITWFWKVLKRLLDNVIDVDCVGTGAVHGYGEGTQTLGEVKGRGVDGWRKSRFGGQQDRNANAVVAGNPARLSSPKCGGGASPLLRTQPVGVVTTTKVPGVTLHQLPLFEDLRGNLSFGEIERQGTVDVETPVIEAQSVGQDPRRVWQRTLSQFLICVHGRVHIVADNGKEMEEFVLDRPNIAVAVPPMVWSVQYRFSQGAVLLALCSDFVLSISWWVSKVPEFGSKTRTRLTPVASFNLSTVDMCRVAGREKISGIEND